MNWLIVASVVLALLFVWLMRTDSEVMDAAVGAVLFGVLIVAILWLVAGINQWDFAPSMARLAEVRSATERLGCTASEDVLGKAADWNQEIQSSRLWNDRWIADPFINDGYDTVTVIQIPSCR